MTTTLLLVASGTLLMVAGINYVSSRATLGTIESHLRSAIRGKGSNLVTTQALALRDLVADNAFGDVARLVSRTLEQDDEVVYGLFLGNDLRPWAFSRRGETGKGQRQLEWTALGIDQSSLRPTAMTTSARQILNEPAYDFSMPVVSDAGEYLGSLHYALSGRSLQRALDEARASSRRTLATTIALLGGLGGVAILLGTLLSRRAAARITRPVGELTDAAERLAGGRRDIRVSIDSGDELELLGAAFNKMVAEIAEAQGRLEQANQVLEAKVQERTRALGIRNRDMRLVLDNVGEGFLTLSPDGRMAQERSAIVDRWFGSYGEGMTFTDYLAPIDAHYAEMFSLAYQALLEDVLPRELCLEQLPTCLRHGEREFRCTYFPILHDEQMAGLLVVVNDITAEVRASQQAAEREEVVALFEAVSRDPSGVLAFFDEGNEYVAALRTASGAVQKRLLHTLKGNCSLMGFAVLGELCHRLEDIIANLPVPLAASSLVGLEDRWSALSKVMNSFVGDKDRDSVELSVRDIDLLEQQITFGASQTLVRQTLASWRLEPVERPLARLGKYARTLATRLGKGDPEVVIASGGMRLAPLVWAPLWSHLIHVVRNAVDHGIESPLDRQRSGKPVRPRLGLATRVQDGTLVIEIEDDGAGIDWEAVKVAALRRGLPHQSQADLTRAIFTADVSTRPTVSTTSGRGIGLAAVAHQVEAAGGTVTVRSVTGQGTCFRFTFPVPQAPPTVDTALSKAGNTAGIVA